VTSDWPPGLTVYLNPGGHVLEMGTEAVASSYASTLGRMNLLLLESTGHRVGERPICACAAMLMMLAAAAKGIRPEIE